jgi:hypothetical protein
MDLIERCTSSRASFVGKSAARNPRDLALRYLDCAMLNWYLFGREAGDLPYQTVRGCFVEGGPAFPGSGIERQSHIQIAVRDPSCIIIGTFRPIL